MTVPDNPGYPYVPDEFAELRRHLIDNADREGLDLLWQAIWRMTHQLLAERYGR